MIKNVYKVEVQPFYYGARSKELQVLWHCYAASDRQDLIATSLNSI